MPLRPRLPLLIWRSIGGELLRILAITCVSLLAVIAFAGAVKPLAEGRIALGDALVLTLLLAVPMLQFALPFAAGFASTMAYHRMASDNEALAAGAGGVSHRAILAPALVVGLILGVTLALLASEAIPTFLRAAERLIQRDITRLLIAPIERGQPIRLGELDIYADDVVADLEPPPGSGALESVVLFGVLAVQPRDDEEGAVNYYSAERVDVLMFEDPEDPETTAVQLVLTGASTNSPEGAGRHRTFSTHRIRIPSHMGDDPKFLSFSELRDVRREPRRMRAVAQRAERLAASLLEHDAIESVRRALLERGQVTLVQREQDRRLIVGADRLEHADGSWRLMASSPGARVTVTLRPDSGAELTQWAGAAQLRLPEEGGAARRVRLSDQAQPRPLELHLQDVVTLDPDGSGMGVEREERTYAGLAPEGAHRSRGDEASVATLLAKADEIARDGSDLSERIQRRAQNLRERVEELRREITSKTHERAAYAVACLVMVLTGAVIAMRMRDSLPLPVYLWSFFPALAAVLTISTGQRLTHRHGDIGLLLLWGGVTALAAYTVVEYTRLRRH